MRTIGYVTTITMTAAAAALGLVIADWRCSVTFSPRLGVRDGRLARAGTRRLSERSCGDRWIS